MRQVLRDQQTHSQSISSHCYRPAYLSSLRTIQETKSPPDEQ
jgi:hypothetical protein